jgi:hypothetical protein
VYELSTVKPHTPDTARFTDAEFQIYHVGYYTALRYALLVMELAHDRWKLRRRHRRAEAKARRAAAAASPLGVTRKYATRVSVPVDQLVDDPAQPGKRVQGKREFVSTLRIGVDTDDVDEGRVNPHGDSPSQMSVDNVARHSAEYGAQNRESQFQNLSERTPDFVDSPEQGSVARPAGESIHRHLLQPTRRNRRRNAAKKERADGPQ